MTKLVGVLSVAVGVGACGASVRTVPEGSHASSIGPTQQVRVVVDEPPPVNKVETIPADPGEPCAWLDGRWEWADRTWEWTPGMWVIPPRACHFAPPSTVWTAVGRGRLFYLSGRWYPDSGNAACELARPCGQAAPRAP